MYGGTYDLLGTNLPGLGIETTFLLANEAENVASALTDRTRMVFFETPTNPTLDVIDIAAVARAANAGGALTVVDNTFASPVNQNPLNLGADIVVHSATKYLGGHSDLTGGAVIGPKDLLEPTWIWRKNLGQRVRTTQWPTPGGTPGRNRGRHTPIVGGTAPQHPDTRRTGPCSECHGHAGSRIPGRPPSRPAGKLSWTGRWLGGRSQADARFRGMLSFVFDGSAEERSRRGIVDGMVRLSCGLEDAADLVDDLAQALS